MGYYLVALVVLVAVVSASAKTLPIMSFDEGYNKLFGDDNLMILKDGKSVHLTLDERTGPLCFSCVLFFLFWVIVVRFVLDGVFDYGFLSLFNCRVWICFSRPLHSWVLQCLY